LTEKPTESGGRRRTPYASRGSWSRSVWSAPYPGAFCCLLEGAGQHWFLEFW